ncbi:hypothetical protein [Paraburkholderia caribensis]|uniref:hypothetical protein n=1 Tax=Paraburkholderia caribensis TaxID=75105 RepID=UPI001D07B850|nr:hypothetical protein [Paraburkholderia caribensis]
MGLPKNGIAGLKDALKERNFSAVWGGVGDVIFWCLLLLFAFLLAFAVLAAWRGRWLWFASVCAGIRDSLARFKRRPCAGRHLLFFAAAKKSRQKKAAHTANS